jgi:hypothetical protein
MHLRLLERAGRLTAERRMVPSYLIVGCKRGGTTSLQAALASHPAVLPPHSGKGTRFFDVSYDKGARWFRAHYPTLLSARLRERRIGHPVISGEASPYYCFHPLGFERIADHLPQCKLIMVTRDPVERAISHYLYERRRGFEEADLWSALAAEPERLAGERERLRTDDSYISFAHRHFSYVSRGRYAEQLARAQGLFDSSQLLVIDHRELFAEPSRAMTRVCDFLGLPVFCPTPFPSFERGSRAGDERPSAELLGKARHHLRSCFAEDNEELYGSFGIDYR